MLSTHILSEAQELCDRVLIIHQGRILAEDTPAELELRVRGAQQVRLEVGGEAPAEALGPRLSALPGVLRVAASTPNHLEVELAPDTPHDVRPALARAVLEAGYDLREMCTVSLSLEDIFLQLIRDEQAEPADTAASDAAPTPTPDEEA